MPTTPKSQAIANQIHEFAEALMEAGACPLCVAKVLVSEGCYLGQHIGELATVTAVTEIYSDDDGPSRACTDAACTRRHGRKPRTNFHSTYAWQKARRIARNQDQAHLHRVRQARARTQRPTYAPQEALGEDDGVAFEPLDLQVVCPCSVITE